MKTRTEKPMTPQAALSCIHKRGLGIGLSLWTLHKLCREDKIKHERSGPGRRAKILIRVSVLTKFAESLSH